MTEKAQEPQAEIDRLRKVVRVLMDRAERSTNLQGTDFNLFQMTVMLEEQVRARTAALEDALRENERVNRALRESETQYRAVLNQSLVGIAIIDQGRLSYANPHFADIFGYPPAEIIGTDPRALIHPEDLVVYDEQVRRRQSGETDRVRYGLRCHRRDGTMIEIEIFGNMAEVAGRPVIMSVVQDVTERRLAERERQELQARLQLLSIQDPLTGLYNRRYLEETLGRELLLAGRQQRPVSLIMCDLDHFKQVNDHHGHQAGDHVLQAFAGLLRRGARGSDVACRFGGEEFVLVLPGMERDGAIQRANQLRLALAASPVRFHGVEIAVTASFGVATCPGNGNSVEALVAAADAALYAAKDAGRNCVV